MPVVSLAQMLESGVHFGHQTRRWNPKMSPYIFTERNGVHIIDLVQTAQLMEDAYEYMRVAIRKRQKVFVRGYEAPSCRDCSPRSSTLRCLLRQPALAGGNAHQLDDY